MFGLAPSADTLECFVLLGVAFLDGVDLIEDEAEAGRERGGRFTVFFRGRVRARVALCGGSGEWFYEEWLEKAAAFRVYVGEGDAFYDEEERYRSSHLQRK